MVYNPCEPLGPRYTHTVMSWPYLTFEAPRQNDFGGHYWDYLARSPKMKSGHDNSFEDMVSVNLLVFNFQMIYKGLIWVMRCEDDSDINGRWGALPSPINSFLQINIRRIWATKDNECMSAPVLDFVCQLLQDNVTWNDKKLFMSYCFQSWELPCTTHDSSAFHL